MIIGIDASRIRSQGGVRHIVELLKESDPNIHGFKEIHIWSYPSLLSQVVDRPWIVKHSPKVLQRSVALQIFWQAFSLDRCLSKEGVNVLFSLDAGTFTKFQPNVILCQDLLPYSLSIFEKFDFSYSRIRAMALRFVTGMAMRKSVGLIFLSNHSAVTVQRALSSLKNISVINHGYNFCDKATSSSPKYIRKKTRLVCVTTSAKYKNRATVFNAVKTVHERGYKVSLTFLGCEDYDNQKSLLKNGICLKSSGLWCKVLPPIPQQQIQSFLNNFDIFIFQSKVEAMPMTLLDGMSSNMAIICSNNQPMPEILLDGGLYYESDNPEMLSHKIIQLINNPELKEQLSQKASKALKRLSWKTTAVRTYSFLAHNYKKNG